MIRQSIFISLFKNKNQFFEIFIEIMKLKNCRQIKIIIFFLYFLTLVAVVCDIWDSDKLGCNFKSCDIYTDITKWSQPVIIRSCDFFQLAIFHSTSVLFNFIGNDKVLIQDHRRTPPNHRNYHQFSVVSFNFSQFLKLNSKQRESRAKSSKFRWSCDISSYI